MGRLGAQRRCWPSSYGFLRCGNAACVRFFVRTEETGKLGELIWSSVIVRPRELKLHPGARSPRLGREPELQLSRLIGVPCAMLRTGELFDRDPNPAVRDSLILTSARREASKLRSVTTTTGPYVTNRSVRISER